VKVAATKSLVLLVLLAFGLLLGTVWSTVSWLEAGDTLQGARQEQRIALTNLRAMAGLSNSPELPLLEVGAENLRLLRLEAERLGLLLRLQLVEGGKQQQQANAAPTYPGVRSAKLQTVIVMGKEEDLGRGIYLLERLVHAAPLGEVVIARRGAELILEATLYGK
jgi:hypothetical protein